VDVLVASLSKLTPEDRRHVQALVDSLLHAQRAGAAQVAPPRITAARRKGTKSPHA
jgi:hypothetical protein